MQVSFIKTSHEVYTLECVRDDGSTTTIALEAKSYLKHDMMHLVFENTAHLQNSFYGRVARGRTLESLTPKALHEANEAMEGEIATTETIVGALQGMLQSNTSPAEAFAHIGEYLTTLGHATPSYFTEIFITAVLDTVRAELRRYDELKTRERLIRKFAI